MLVGGGGVVGGDSVGGGGLGWGGMRVVVEMMVLMG